MDPFLGQIIAWRMAALWSRDIVSGRFMRKSMLFCKELNVEFKRLYSLCDAFSFASIVPSSCFKSVYKRVVYIHQYRIDEYAEYLYREKEVELVNLPIEEVKRAIAEADFI